MKEKGKLVLALQKGGRLNEDSLKLLKDCGLKISNGSRKLKADAQNFPLEILFLRDDDIAQYVADGVAQIGILGLDVCREDAKEVRELKGLSFAKCRLALAVPKDFDYQGLLSLNGKRIATSFPKLLHGYLEEKGITAEIEYLSGSVEIAPGIGLSDAICDIVSSGSTLVMNGLKEVETVLQSEAILIAHPHLSSEQEQILEDLLFRIEAVQRAAQSKYITLNAPNAVLAQIREVLPGMKSPTIIPLADANWSAVHSVVPEASFWDSISKLKKLGAEGILVIPIEKMIL
tara:strand:+ start:3357 stop:4223 length:867 start_codon:yes stop_codon:yes gene_type:complete